MLKKGSHRLRRKWKPPGVPTFSHNSVKRRNATSRKVSSSSPTPCLSPSSPSASQVPNFSSYRSRSSQSHHRHHQHRTSPLPSVKSKSKPKLSSLTHVYTPMRSFLVSLFLVGSVAALVLPVRIIAHRAFLQFPPILNSNYLLLSAMAPPMPKGTD